MGATLGPALGAIIGGLLNQCLGWRFIFGFLTIFVGIMMLLTLLCFPETSRSVVGNGSIPPQKWNISVLDLIKWHRQRNSGVQWKLRDCEEKEKTKSAWRRQDRIAEGCRHNPLLWCVTVRRFLRSAQQSSFTAWRKIPLQLSPNRALLSVVWRWYIASVFIRAYGWVIISRLASLVRC